MSFPIASTIEATAAAIAAGGFIYSAGRNSARVGEIARSVDKLTSVFEKVVERYDEMFKDHEHRITVVETKLEK
jgi:hypothetical protein